MHERAHRGGLRERKRVSAMRHIQQVAIDLFDERGFDAVTIEAVAAAAEVSPSSVYRYFGTKEGLVVRDDADRTLVASFAAHLVEHDVWDAVDLAIEDADPAGFEPVAALHLARMRLFHDVPSVRGRLLVEAADAIDELAGVLMSPTAKVPRSRFEARVVATALVGALVVAAQEWYAAGGAAPILDLARTSIDLVRTDRQAGRGDRPGQGS
ncbi:MAG TPA: TetR family transcriptional regulator [Candidatus Lustribacter sp.]|nr:TetR family transcriptional regulator [Candidatus Lustribacter sp.]